MKHSPEICRAAVLVQQRAKERRRALRKLRRKESLAVWMSLSQESRDRIERAEAQFKSNGVTIMNLYNCKSVSDGYRITKFTRDYVVESSYVVSAEGCDCPAGHRPVCRHRTMLPFFEDGGHIDDGWFFIWDTRQWLKPIGEAEDLAQQNEDWKVRPQGAPSTSTLDQPSLDQIDFDKSAKPGEVLLETAPPRESDTQAPQTEPASAEGAGSIKWRRPKL